MYRKLPFFCFLILSIFSFQNLSGQDCTVPLSTPYLQPFTELNDDDLPVCWQEADNGFPDVTGPLDIGDGSWREDGFSNNGSEGAMRIRISSDSKQDWIISPIVNIPTTGIQVDFDFAITAFSSSFPINLGSDDEVRFLLSPDAGATWVTLQTWTQADNVDPLGENKVYDLTAYSGMDLIFAFWAYEGTVDDNESIDVFVDNFAVRTPPTCFVPLTPVISGIGSITANLGWSPSLEGETTWDIEVVEGDATPTGIPTMGYDDVTETSVTLSALLPETSYDVYIRSDCGMDNSSDLSTWSGPFNFTTGCAAFNTPYQENFSVTPGPFGGAAICWSEANEGSFTDGPSDFGSSSWSVNETFANFGDKSMRINLWQSGDVDWLLTPKFLLESSQEYLVEFDLAVTNFNTTDPSNFGSDDRFVLLISDDNGGTWTPLQFWTSAETVGPEGVKITNDISSYAGSEVNFAFWASEGVVDDPEDYEIFIDNFFVRNPPTCSEISDLAVTGIAPTLANVSWSGGAPATVWDIEFVEAGTLPTGIPTVGNDDVTNPAVITGLTPETEYDIYVRSDCGMDNSSDVSAWTGPIAFETPCVVDAPYVENFDIQDALPDCWSALTGGDPTSGPFESTSSNWRSSFDNPGTFELSLPGFFDVNDWLISPPINLNGGAYQVEIDLSILDAENNQMPGTLGSDDRVILLMSTDFMETWTALDTWTASSVIDVLVLEITQDLTPYADLSPVFAIYTSLGDIEDPEQNLVVIDKFEITELTIVPMTVSTETTDVSCNGSTDGAIDLNVTGGQMPLSYVWSTGSMEEDIADLSAGDYTVTVTSSDATTIEATITISEPTVLEGSTTVVDETIIGAADGSIDLTVSGGTEGYSFSWDNGATTEDLTGIAPGNYCVTINDANNCQQTTCAEVMSGTVSTQNISDLTSFRVYPNPVGDQKFIIDLEFSLVKDLEIQLVNILGQEVSKNEYFTVSDLKFEMNATPLPTGIYFIKVTDLKANQIMTHRLVKQ